MNTDVHAAENYRADVEGVIGAMTEASTPSASWGNSRLAWRKTSVAWVAAFVLAGTLATTLTVGHLERQYGPIQNGPFGGVYSARDLVVKPDGTSSGLAGRSDATAQLLASLANAGSHSVKVTAIETDNVVTNVRWSSLHIVPGGAVSGVSTPWRDFPAVIPAHTTIRLLVTLHRPANCRTSHLPVVTDDLYRGSHRVHWESLRHSHITAIDDQIAGIHLC